MGKCNNGINDLCDSISDSAEFFSLSFIVREKFKLGLKAKNNNHEASEVYNKIVGIVSEYLGLDDWDEDENITIKKLIFQKNLIKINIP